MNYRAFPLHSPYNQSQIQKSEINPEIKKTPNYVEILCGTKALPVCKMKMQICILAAVISCFVILLMNLQKIPSL